MGEVSRLRFVDDPNGGLKRGIIKLTFTEASNSGLTSLLSLYMLLSKWTTNSQKATMESKKIIEQLNQEIKDLIPLKGFRARFELQPSLGEKWRPDFVGKVFFKNLQFKIVGEIVSQQSFSMFKEKISLLKSYAGQDLDSVPVILAEYLSANRRKECQNAGIYFVDMSGNVFLEYDGLYIERVGFPNRFPEKRKGRGPFSDKASQSYVSQ